MLRWSRYCRPTVTKTFARRNSSEAGDAHSRYNLHPWPNSRRPTPFEIFNIHEKDHNLPTSEFNKILRLVFTGYMKIYHPDVSRSRTVFDNKNRELSPEQKKERFDQIINSYDILKNPRRRIAYTKYSDTSWDAYRPNASSFEAYRMANVHRSKYAFENDEQFWHASNWEDYYKRRFNRPPPTKEELEKNKYKILAGVLAVAAISTGLQFMLAVKRADEFKKEIELLNLEASKNLQESKNNYGQGTTRFQRLRRFLIQRRSSLDLDDETMEKIRQDEHDILVRYARKQVGKSDVAA